VPTGAGGKTSDAQGQPDRRAPPPSAVTPESLEGHLARDAAFLLESHGSRRRFGVHEGFSCRARRKAYDVFSATAARMSAFNAFSSILSPSWKSMARLVLPSRLELKRPEGSANEAPLKNVSLTLSW